jgi:hypothetical protein
VKRTLRVDKMARLCGFFGVVLVSLLILSALVVFQTKASLETMAAVVNPVTLFETPDVMRVTFQICSSNEYVSSSKVDFQLGETVYLRLAAEYYHGGDIPLIANNTVFVVSDDTEAVIWNVSMCQFGGGWILNAGGEADVAKWVPEKTGNYSAGVVFEETSYPNNFSKVMSFRVLALCPFIGKVTELDGVTPIGDALVEALQGNEVKANATTDNEGRFTMRLEEAETYDVRISAFGYLTTVQKGLCPELENTSLDISLASSPQPDVAMTQLSESTEPELSSICFPAVSNSQPVN